jgi:uncharacterized membrane protein
MYIEFNVNPTPMLGLTPLGTFHTAISLIAVTSGAIALIRDKEITWENTIGKIYVVTTIVVCLTGFGIFEHGGFGKPHVLGIITLVVLGIAYAAGKKNLFFGKASPYVETVGYSTTFFFHIVPGVTETATRLPLGAPLASSPDDPNIQMTLGICFVLFLIGATLQVVSLRRKLQTRI